MSETVLSRREFSAVLGAVAARAIVPQHALGRFAIAKKRLGEPVGAILLNSNENPYGPSPRALEALRSCGTIAARYPDAARERMCDALARMHGLQPANILLGCGSTEILRVADAAFLAPDKSVVVAEPTFEAVLNYARVTRATPVKVPLAADLRHDLPRMAAVCTSKTGIVYICNPNNPTGTIVTSGEMESFFRRIPPSTLILVDEAYHHFVENPQYASATEWIGKIPNLVVCRTFSKAYGMAGMRLGYGLGAKDTIAAMREQLLEDNANAAVLAAAAASLADTEYVAAVSKRLNATRRWLASQLAKDGRRVTPSEANFLMVDVGSDVTPFIQEFRARGILVGRRYPSMGNWLRVSIGTEKETEAFLKALREIQPTSASRAA